MPLKVYIQHNPVFYSKVQWFFYLLTSVRKIDFDFIPVKEEADIKVGNGIGFDIGVSTKFYDKLSLELFDHSVFFDEELMVFTEEKEEDLISTVFYLVNCIQEYKADQSFKDEYGRFKKESSLQQKFDLLEENHVVKLIDQFLLKYKIEGGQRQKSRVYISHDIDFLTSGFRQEFTESFKKGQVGKAISFARQRMAGESPWNNIDEVIALNQKLNVPATFYWLNYKEHSKEGIQNADYELSEEMLSIVTKSGMSNGLHKSATDYTFRKETGDFPIPIEHSRNHFLKMKLPYLWEETHKSKIKTDGSLGFSRGKGFRNSFGLPFYPFNLKVEIPYRTLVLPLQIMDVGLDAHGSRDRHKVVEEVMAFVNKNKEDCLLSLLFHNNELTPYSNNYMLEAYKDIVDILNEEGIEIIGIDDVVKIYG